MKKTFLAGLALLLAGGASLVFAGKEDDAKKYIQDLKTSKDVQVKVIAVTEIGNIGMVRKSYVKDAVPLLVESCKAKEPKLRAAAAEALGKVDPPTDANAVELLTDIVKTDKDTDVKLAATRGLAALGAKAKSALPTLQEIVKNEDKKSKLYRGAMDASRAIREVTKK
ncbi:MAG: HEAT repeat domain-containing protein [Gemmataceae bacterium]